MSPKNTPYPFDDIPANNYFGEFRELSNSIGQFENKEKEKNHTSIDNGKSDDAFNEFSIFPKY
jgi:hypothetical protein